MKTFQRKSKNKAPLLKKQGCTNNSRNNVSLIGDIVLYKS